MGVFEEVGEAKTSEVCETSEVFLYGHRFLEGGSFEVEHGFSLEKFNIQVFS